MSRFAKYLLAFILSISLSACGSSSQPGEDTQDLPDTVGTVTDTQPETLETPDADLTVESITEYEDMLDPQGEPLSEWNGIPIMSQATTGEAFDTDRYSYKADTTSEDAQKFYKDTLGGLGWSESYSLPADERSGAAIIFEKESSILTITFSQMDGYLLIILNLA